MAQLPIGTGHGRTRKVIGHVLVDEDDFDRLNKFKWSRSPRGYVQGWVRLPGNPNKEKQLLSRFIVGACNEDVHVGFVSQDRSDYRRSNLVVGDYVDVVQTRSLVTKGGTSKYRGVKRIGTKWESSCIIRGEEHLLGQYGDELVAAKSSAAYRIKYTFPSSQEDIDFAGDFPVPVRQYKIGQITKMEDGWAAKYSRTYLGLWPSEDLANDALSLYLSTKRNIWKERETEWKEAEKKEQELTKLRYAQQIQFNASRRGISETEDGRWRVARNVQGEGHCTIGHYGTFNEALGKAAAHRLRYQPEKVTEYERELAQGIVTPLLRSNEAHRAEKQSGVTGVIWSKSKDRWESSIKVKQTEYNLGTYIELSEAIDARKKAEFERDAGLPITTPGNPYGVSGKRGIHFYSNNEKPWCARTIKFKHSYKIGDYSTVEEAIEAQRQHAEENEDFFIALEISRRRVPRPPKIPKAKKPVTTKKDWEGANVNSYNEPDFFKWDGKYPQGYVYLLRCEETNRYKIGWTSSDPPTRRVSNIQTSSPTKLSFVGAVKARKAHEKQLHWKYREERMRGEWFQESTELLKLVAMFGDAERPWDEEVILYCDVTKVAWDDCSHCDELYRASSLPLVR